MGKGKKKSRPKGQINHQMEIKLAGLSILVLLALIGLMGRIVYLNVVKGETYRKEVLTQAHQQYSNKELPAKRGDIYDRNGNLLATSNKVYNIVLDCRVINSDPDKYREETVRVLTEVLGLDKDKIDAKLDNEETKDSPYQIIKREATIDEKRAYEKSIKVTEEDDDEEKQRKNKVKGVWFEENYKRIYPFNGLACDVIGFTFDRNTADYGIEGYYNSILSGTDGRRYGSFSNDSSVEQAIISPVSGSNITSTIDSGIQEIVEKYVDAFNEAMGAKNIGVIIEDPSSGEILAMDGGDRYDLNNPRKLDQMYTEEEIKEMNDSETVEALNKMWGNYCITDAFEPGSTVKPLIMASALEQGKISKEDTFVCDGAQNFGAAGNVTTIKCAAYPDAHGEESLAEAIAYSCNDAMMQIANLMGKEQFIETQEIFNFGQRTGIDLPGEGYGLVHSMNSLGETELACSSFGQGLTCTMIQEINAICSLINGGYYYQPHVVKKIESSNGITKLYEPILMKQTISESISAEIKEYMRAAVKIGTAYASKVQGYSMGGKTGTAEKLPRGNGKYLVSFIGFAPVESPELVIYVVIDEPNTDQQANSAYAQYIAQAILSEVLPYMNIPMDEVYDGYIPETELWEGFSGRVRQTDVGTLDENGNLIDSNGNRIDWEGNRIDENGYLLDEAGNYKVDENGEYILSEFMTIDSYKSENGLPEGISDVNVPAPREDTSEIEINNNMESEGLTNEEAGLE